MEKRFSQKAAASCEKLYIPIKIPKVNICLRLQMFLVLTGLLRYRFQNEKATFSGTGFRFWWGFLVGFFSLKKSSSWLLSAPCSAFPERSPGGGDANPCIFTADSRASLESQGRGPCRPRSMSQKPTEGTFSEGVKHRGIHPSFGNPAPGAGRGREGGWGSIAACWGGPYPFFWGRAEQGGCSSAGGSSRGGTVLLFGTLGNSAPPRRRGGNALGGSSNRNRRRSSLRKTPRSRGCHTWHAQSQRLCQLSVTHPPPLPKPP